MTEKERLIEILSRYFQIGDSYAYNLTRDKAAFSVGTMHLDDFEEFDEVTIADIADHLLTNGVVVPPCKVGDTVYKIIKDCSECPNFREYFFAYDCCCSLDDGKTMFDCDFDKDCIYKIEEILFTHAIMDGNSFGKTVFLTREEAEKGGERNDLPINK